METDKEYVWQGDKKNEAENAIAVNAPCQKCNGKLEEPLKFRLVSSLETNALLENEVDNVSPETVVCYIGNTFKTSEIT